VEWLTRVFTLVDTGGIVGASDDPMWLAVADRGRRAAEAVDLVVLVVDGREGSVPADEEVARELHIRGRPVIVAVNKTDARLARGRVPEFHQLGFDTIVEISAEHGLGIGDLLDAVISRLPVVGPERVPDDTETETDVEAETSIAVVGRPNVGKSSLMNRLLREDRVMVSATPGTTRDAIDEVVQWHQRRFRIVDTAGIRRPGRVAGGGQVEAVSVVRARHAMEQADVAVLVVDASAGVGKRDASVAGEAEAAGCGLIIAANKWDLVKGRGPNFAKEFDEQLRDALKFADYVPVVHLSALTGDRTQRLLPLVDEVGAARKVKVPTAELNRVLDRVTTALSPSGIGRGSVRIKYGVQSGVAPPIFTLFTSGGVRLHFSYERYLQNQFREAFGFQGTPIRLKVRGR
jgi:GTP-binding protein